MTTLQAVGGGAGLTYLIGAVWFLFLERKEKFLFWRILSTVCSPITVPLLAVLGLALIGIEKFFSRQPKEAVKSTAKK